MSRMPSIASCFAAGALVLVFSLFAACSDTGDPAQPDGDVDQQDGDVDPVEIEPEEWVPTACTSDDDCEGYLVCHTEVQGGICLETCDFGLPDAQGDDYCALFAEGYLCQAQLGQVCTPACQRDSDCSAIAAGTRCGSDGRCLPPAECSSNDDCTLGRLCMPEIDGGTCMIDCRLTYEGKTGDALCQQAGEEYVCYDKAGGYCGPACQNDDPCTVLHPLYTCGDDQRCQSPSGINCTLNSECGTGEACHHSTDDATTLCSNSCITGDFGLGGDAYCDYVLPGTVCHTVFGGSCRKPCADTPECQAVDDNLECSNDGHCIPLEINKACSDDTDCAQGMMCHPDWHVKDQTLGTCGTSCIVGGPVGNAGEMLTGDEYCGQLFEGGKCNEWFGGLCQEPCSDDDACVFYGDDAVCLNSSVCRSLASIESCTDTGECPVDTVCHTYVGAGVCAPDCSVGDERGVDNGYCNALSSGFICQVALGNVCGPRCVEDAFCRAEDDVLRCRADGECTDPAAAPVCANDTECPEDTICQTQVPGAACLPSCTIGLNGITGDAFCSLYTTEGALCYGNQGGLCIPKCGNDGDCRLVNPDWSCDTELGLCGIPYTPASCSSTDTCPYGMVCHSQGADPGMCGVPCVTNADCPSVGTEGNRKLRYCSSQGECRLFDDRTSPCEVDADCDVGLVCHLRNESGVCAPACQHQSDCFATLGTNFICTGGYCRRGTVESWGSCTGSGDCAFGFSCLDDVCKPDSPQNYAPCGDDGDCAHGYVCNDVFGLKACYKKCTQSTQCNAIAPGLYCTQDQHCVSNAEANNPCIGNTDCAYGQACHQFELSSAACGTACTGNADCQLLEAGLNCFNDGRCRPASLIDQGCSTGEDCLPGDVCHPDASAEGICAAACTADADCATLGSGLACNGEARCVPSENLVTPCAVSANCPVDTVCMSELGGGMCKPPCTTNTQCGQYAADYICRSDATCVAPAGIHTPCETNLDCALGKVCNRAFGTCTAPCATVADCDAVFGEGFLCSDAGECIPNSSVGGCEADADCPGGQICNTDQHICWTPCTAHADCLRFGRDFCNALGQCIDDPLTTDCSVDAQCAVGQLCMKDTTNGMMACATACEDSVVCNDVSINLECRADHRCHRAELVDGCEDLGDCYIGQVCHPDVVTIIGETTIYGLCMAPCTGESQCNSHAADLYCDAEQYCVPEY